MLLRRRIVLCGRSIGALSLFVLGSSACGDDTAVVTHTESGSGSGSGSSITTITTTPTSTATPTSTSVTTGGSEADTTGGTGGESGGGLCVLLQKPCTETAKCCEGGEFSGCLGQNYPNNWSCVSGFCEHAGCDPMSDTDCTNLLPGFECHVVNGKGQCVAPCTSNIDCSETFTLSDLQCTGMSPKGSFCQ